MVIESVEHSRCVMGRIVSVCKRCGYIERCGSVGRPYYHTKFDFLVDIVLRTNNCIYKKIMEAEDEQRVQKQIEDIKGKSLEDYSIFLSSRFLPVLDSPSSRSNSL